MIHFRCVQCDKGLKVPEGKAGSTVLCPRCQERLVVPSAVPTSLSEEPTDSQGQTPELEGVDQQPTSSYLDQVVELFAGMSPGLRMIEVLLVGLCLITFLLAVLALFLPLGGFAEVVISSAMFLVPLFIVTFLVILYGHATSCPLCGRWWARSRYATEFLGREVFDRNGDSFARSTYRTTYICNACKH